MVVVPFPFSDISQAKRRAALVLAALTGGDRILCQITSQSVRDEYAISLAELDFLTGTLHRQSTIRPNRLFTADSRVILYPVGRLRPDKISEVVDKIVGILRQQAGE